MAAVLAGGTGAVLSHASAAAAWKLRPIGGGAIHVTIPRDSGRAATSGHPLASQQDAHAHDTTVHRGIPTTTPLRTVIDLAATLAAARSSKRSTARSNSGSSTSPTCTARPIRSSLQAVLSRYTAGSTLTRSELEDASSRLCDDHGLPRPETNTRIDGIEVDFVWRDAKLIVEVDGYAHHRSPDRLRARPRAGRDPHGRRLARDALHLRPDHPPPGWVARRDSASFPAARMPTIVTLPGDGIGPEVLAPALDRPRTKSPPTSRTRST